MDDLSRKVALGEKNQERAADQIQRYKTEQTQAQTAVAKLNREIDDNARYLKEAEDASDGCTTSIDEYGHKVKDASDKPKDLGDIAKVAIGNVAAKAVTKLADTAVDAAKAMVEVGSNFEAVGTNMAAALAAGIRAGESQAINAAVHMAVEAYKRAKDAIGQKWEDKDQRNRRDVCGS